MHFENIAHDVVEHEETGSFLNGGVMGLAMVEEIENGGDEFVHSLYIVNFWIESTKDEQNSCHVVVSVDFMIEIEIGRFYSSTDEFTFLFASISEKRKRKCWGGCREEG